MSVFNVFCPLLCGSLIRNIESHLKICKNKEHLNKYYFQCPFNPNHICSKNVFPIHKESCPDKKVENLFLTSDKINHNENDSPKKSTKIIKSYYSAPFQKKDQIIRKNGTPNFLTEKIENEKINVTPEKKDKKNKIENIEKEKFKDNNITPNKAELLFNYNDNLSTGKKKILLKPTPMKIKNKTNLLNHNDIDLNKNYELNNSISEKKLLDGNKSNDSLKIAITGKLKRKLNFDNDCEISGEKDYSSIYSARTDISSDSSLKNIKKKIKKKVNFNKKIRVFVYSKKRNDDENSFNENKTNKIGKKCKSDIKKSNSDVFIEIYSKFL